MEAAQKYILGMGTFYATCLKEHPDYVTCRLTLVLHVFQYMYVKANFTFQRPK